MYLLFCLIFPLFLHFPRFPYDASFHQALQWQIPFHWQNANLIYWFAKHNKRCCFNEYMIDLSARHLPFHCVLLLQQKITNDITIIEHESPIPPIKYQIHRRICQNVPYEPNIPAKRISHIVFATYEKESRSSFLRFVPQNWWIHFSVCQRNPSHAARYIDNFNFVMCSEAEDNAEVAIWVAFTITTLALDLADYFSMI